MSDNPFQFIEAGSRVPGKCANSNRVKDITVTVCDCEEAILNDDGAPIINMVYCRGFIRGVGIQIIKGLIDLHHEAIFFLGMDVEQLKGLLAVFQQEQAGELRLVDPLILYNMGLGSVFHSLMRKA